VLHYETKITDWVLKLPINTTKTAQYAAQAAKSSCLLAVVKMDIAILKTTVKTIRIPIASKAANVG
jgi:hypothetical protein